MLNYKLKDNLIGVYRLHVAQRIKNNVSTIYMFILPLEKDVRFKDIGKLVYKNVLPEVRITEIQDIMKVVEFMKSVESKMFVKKFDSRVLDDKKRQKEKKLTKDVGDAKDEIDEKDAKVVMDEIGK